MFPFFSFFVLFLFYFFFCSSFAMLLISSSCEWFSCCRSFLFGLAGTDTLIGTAMVKLQPLEDKCTLHEAYDVSISNFPPHLKFYFFTSIFLLKKLLFTGLPFFCETCKSLHLSMRVLKVLTVVYTGAASICKKDEPRIMWMTVLNLLRQASLWKPSLTLKGFIS